MNPVVVTGFSGFLGIHLQTALQRNHYAVAGIPREVRRSTAHLRRFFESYKPAAIVHLAGIVDVRYCHQHPVEAFQAHVSETAQLVEAARGTCPDTPLIYVASDKSFGEQDCCTLTTPYQPSFPYETSKACEDLLLESYAKTYSLPIYLLRFANFFGEGDRHLERLIPSICTAAIEDRELVIRTRLDGTARQYIYVQDAADILVRTIRACIAHEPVWPKNHFGPPHIKTVGDVIRDLETVTGRSLRVKVLDLPGEVSRLSLRDDNFLGYTYTDWLPALERTTRWYREQSTHPEVASTAKL